MAQNASTRSRPPPFGDGKLDGTNYTLWKFKIRAILDSYELWEIATGVDVKSGPIVDPNDPSQTLPPDPALALAWKRRNADALCAIVTSVNDSVMTLIQHTTSASEAWQVLQN